MPWLRRMAVRYVLLPRTQIGRAGEEKEARLLLSGRSGLRLVLRTPNWRIYELPGARPMLTGPGGARIVRYGHDVIEGSTARAGDYRFSVRFSEYWRVATGGVCLREAADGMTVLHAFHPGAFRLEIALGAHGSAVCDPTPSR